MKAKLFRSGIDKGEPFEIGAEATIGRARENSIQLEPKAVSSRHARIYFDPATARYYLEDLGSLNGTKLDGVEITRTEQLDRLHVIEFGGDGLEFVFHAVDLDAAESAAEDGGPAAPGAATAVDQEMPEIPSNLVDESEETDMTAFVDGTAPDSEMPAVPEALLDESDAEETIPVTTQPEAGERPEGADESDRELVAGKAPFYLRLDEPADLPPIPLLPGKRVVGRARSADVSVESGSVSRRHALLTIGATVTVRDLGSRNHTFVDDVRVEDEVTVEPGSRLRFGALEATLLAGTKAG